MLDVMVPFRLVAGVWKENERVSFFTSNDLTLLDEVQDDTSPQQAIVEYNGRHVDVTIYVAPDGETGYVLAKELEA